MIQTQINLNNGKVLSYPLKIDIKFLIPPKFGNGHLVLSEFAIFHYKQNTQYDRVPIYNKMERSKF